MSLLTLAKFKGEHASKYFFVVVLYVFGKFTYNVAVEGGGGVAPIICNIMQEQIEPWHEVSNYMAF